jgi:hypothetical protein
MTMVTGLFPLFGPLVSGWIIGCITAWFATERLPSTVQAWSTPAGTAIEIVGYGLDSVQEVEFTASAGPGLHRHHTPPTTARRASCPTRPPVR